MTRATAIFNVFRDPLPCPVAEEVHVWSSTLDPSSPNVAMLAKLLSPDEVVRVQRFRFERDRRRFTVARGLLRLLMGSLTGHEPERLQFCYGPWGKPALVPEPGGPTIHFNVSHSEEMAVYAFARDRELGIDVERLRPINDLDRIAAHFFAPGERLRLREVPVALRAWAFLACWTRKEAYIKALGVGLTLPLDRFEVSLAPGEPACMLAINGNPVPAANWHILEQQPEAGYLGALAIAGRRPLVRCFHHSWP